jgi:hypothetical protein
MATMNFLANAQLPIIVEDDRILRSAFRHDLTTHGLISSWETGIRSGRRYYRQTVLPPTASRQAA